MTSIFLTIANGRRFSVKTSQSFILVADDANDNIENKRKDQKEYGDTFTKLGIFFHAEISLIPQAIKDMCQLCKGIVNFFLLLFWRGFVVILAIEAIAKDIKGTRNI